MRPFLERPVANPSSQHGPGRAARAAVETAREQVAALVGADPAQVIFTSGGTEADNLAIKGTVLLREPGARHLVVSAVEHHAVLDAAEWAVVDAGATVALAPVDGLGRLDLGRLGELLEPGRTALVAVMAANNEVGTLQPVAAAAERAHAAGAVVLCDAVQAARHPGVDMAAGGLDLVALASHKLGGPTGVGALVTRAGLPLRPLVHGGGQERGMRSGTLPVAAVVGFGAAAALALAEREAGAGSLLPVRLPGRRSEDVLLLLDRDEVACSAGSACASGAVGASHVLLAMGRTPAEARETIRLSLGHGSGEPDVDAAVDALRHALAVLDAGPGKRHGGVPVGPVGPGNPQGGVPVGPVGPGNPQGGVPVGPVVPGGRPLQAQPASAGGTP